MHALVDLTGLAVVLALALALTLAAIGDLRCGVARSEGGYVAVICQSSLLR